MNKIPALSFGAKSYYLLTKPGIIMGNAMTAVGGFALAAKHHFNLWLFLATLIGLSLTIASACVFNNYIDRFADEKMARTKNRPLATGAISTQSALLFAISLGLLGTLILALFSNLLATFCALFGFFVYTVLYSFSKYHSIHGTLIGSVAGALPPVVGYCAVSQALDTGALILFIMMALWQMPHFFAIAINRLADYAAASIPVLPLKKGMHATKIQMALYIVAFIAASSSLSLFGYTGKNYLIATLLLGFSWLFLCLKGFKCDNDKLWARKMFAFSLVVILGLCALMPFS